MTIARSVADVLSEHVRFGVECIDRMYPDVYQPKLQYAAGSVGYVHRQLRLPIASTAPLAKITDRFVAGGAPVRRHRGHRVGGLREGAAAERRGGGPVVQVHARAGGGVHRPGAGEDHGVPHREASTRGRGGLSVDREVDRSDQPFYFYCVYSDLVSSFSSSAPTSRTTPSCVSTATTGRNAKPPGPGWGTCHCTTRSRRSTTRPGCWRSATVWAPRQIQELSRPADHASGLFRSK